MAKLFVVVSFFCLMGSSFGMPASNEQLDKNYRKAGQYVKTTKINQSMFKDNLDDVVYYQRDSVATVNDVAVNAVAEDKKPEQQPVQQPLQPQNPPSTVEISGITTGANPAPANPVAPQDGGFRPQRAGSMFARIIDDIFQIPITVLQNVARLITNPFTQARKEAATAAAAPAAA